MLLVHQQRGEKTHVRLRFCQQGRRRPNRVVVGRFILWWLFGRQLRRVQSLMKESLKIGTRASKLALWQANFIKSEIERLFDQLEHDSSQADDLKKLFDERLARLEIASG